MASEVPNLRGNRDDERLAGDLSGHEATLVPLRSQHSRAFDLRVNASHLEHSLQGDFN